MEWKGARRVYRGRPRNLLVLSCAETNVRRHTSHGRVYFFPQRFFQRFFERSIDRSIRTARSFVERGPHRCAVIRGQKGKRPTNTSQKQGQQVSCGYVCVRNVTTHRSRSSRTRDIFPDTSVNVFHGMSRGELVCEGLVGCSRWLSGILMSFDLGNVRTLEFCKSWTILSRIDESKVCNDRVVSSWIFFFYLSFIGDKLTDSIILFFIFDNNKCLKCYSNWFGCIFLLYSLIWKR